MKFVYLFAIDLVFLLIMLLVVFPVIKLWCWWKNKDYSWDSAIGDLFLVFSSWAYGVVATTVMPLVEASCFTIGQQELSISFSLLPVIFLILGIMGISSAILFKSSATGLKISISMAFLGWLGISVIRTIRRMEPCQEPLFPFQDSIALSTFEMITFIAALITIVTTIILIINWVLARE